MEWGSVEGSIEQIIIGKGERGRGRTVIRGRGREEWSFRGVSREGSRDGKWLGL